MKHIISLCLMLFVVFAGKVALGDDNDKQLPAGKVAYHFLARITFFPTSELVGYLAFIEGVPGPFFAETDQFGAAMPPGESTAFFTTRVTAGVDPIFLSPGADIQTTILPPGTMFDVYLDKTPDQDWADPDSFSDGKLVATFKESGLMATNITGAGASYVLFSSELVYSKRFRFNGKRIDFKDLVGNGITINNFGSLTPVEGGPGLTQAFTGSAVAIGGKDD